MNKDELIIKWLSGDLNPREEAEFDKLPESEDYRKIDAAAQSFKPAEFATDDNYKKLKEELSTQQQKGKNKTWLLQIAAILILALSIGYGVFYQKTDNKAVAQRAETTHLTLPENSDVELNASSELTFNSDQWENNRLVHLKGEAFFHVAEGSRFEVKTALGSVVVKGTQFNVKQRDDRLAVVCYSGKVAVNTENTSVLLTAGESWSVKNPEQKQSVTQQKPAWLKGRSTFKSIPVAEVFKALERQYDIDIHIEKRTFNTDQAYTGSFDNHDLDKALKSVLMPFDWSYEKSGKKIRIIKGDN